MEVARLPVIPLYAALGVGLLALLVARTYQAQMMRAEIPNGPVRDTANSIHQGNDAYLASRLRWVALVVGLLAVGLGLTTGGWGAIPVVVGGLVAAGAELWGLRTTSATSPRTAAAGGLMASLDVAWRGSAAIGFAIPGLGLTTLVVTLLIVTVAWPAADWVTLMAGLVLGASAVSLFARVGGGLFTTSVDLGADLTARDNQIDEHDPRNPAAVADSVGDGVGAAGAMGSDLLDSHLGSAVAALAYAGIGFASDPWQPQAMVYPVAIAAVALLASAVGAAVFRSSDEDVTRALRRATYVGAALTVLGVAGLGVWLFSDVPGIAHPTGLSLAVVAGLVSGLLIAQISDWFTSDRYLTAKEVARNAPTGSAPLILSGLSEGLRSAVLSAVVLAVGIGAAFAAGVWALGDGGGVYGVTIGAVGALGIVALPLSLSAWSGIVDSAGSIAHLADLSQEAVETTESLDAVGSTSAPAAKGFAIGAAALTAFALQSAYNTAVGPETLDLAAVPVAAGLLLGATVPFLFAALIMRGVSRAAKRVIDESERQLKETGLRERTQGVVPDYLRSVEVAAAAALPETVAPVVLALALPVLVGLADVRALAGFLAGSLVTGLLLGATMVNSGGAWDNAKRLIESGAFGGRGSEAHMSAMTGDTVGDSFKDACGPSLTVLIKTTAVVSLVFAPLFIR
ncbi:MAG TPA: sodium-translocating pyrophosphatase [Acidimicrobiia bacterium]|jgi:K(+)-stimulated pyrophosphate-energized sodium pump